MEVVFGERGWVSRKEKLGEGDLDDVEASGEAIDEEGLEGNELREIDVVVVNIVTWIINVIDAQHHGLLLERFFLVDLRRLCVKAHRGTSSQRSRRRR